MITELVGSTLPKPLSLLLLLDQPFGKLEAFLEIHHTIVQLVQHVEVGVTQASVGHAAGQAIGQGLAERAFHDDERSQEQPKHGLKGNYRASEWGAVWRFKAPGSLGATGAHTVMTWARRLDFSRQ